MYYIKNICFGYKTGILNGLWFVASARWDYKWWLNGKYLYQETKLELRSLECIIKLNAKDMHETALPVNRSISLKKGTHK